MMLVCLGMIVFFMVFIRGVILNLFFVLVLYFLSRKNWIKERFLLFIVVVEERVVLFRVFLVFLLVLCVNNNCGIWIFFDLKV